MVCKGCGAKLMETDQFCPKCGTKVIKEMRCAECGAVLREGTKFCHKCGRLVDGGRRRQEETEDLPIEVIEQNILSETAAELKADRNDGHELRRKASSEGRAERSAAPRRVAEREISPSAESGQRNVSKSGSGVRTAEHVSASKKTAPKGSTSGSAPSKSTSGRNMGAQGHSTASVKAAPGKRPAPPSSGKRRPEPEPPRRKRVDYREDDWEDEDWDDEDDWDDDDDDEEGLDVITIMTVVAGCVLLIVVAVLGYHFYKQYAPKNYEKKTESQADDNEVDEDGDEGEQQEPDKPDENEQLTADNDESGTFQIIVTGKEVNVRDLPSTSGTNVLTVARKGDVFACYGTAEDGQWYEIRLEDGTPGYVFHEYVSVEEGASVSITEVKEQNISE